MAVFTIGATIGSGTAYLFGGMIVDAVAQTPTYVLPLLGEVRSWQAVFFFIGIPGILLAFIVFTFPEPVRRNIRHYEISTSLWTGVFNNYRELLAFMASKKRFFAHHYSGFALGSMVMSGSVVSIWRAPLTPGEIGLWLGSVVVVSAITGKLLCGYMVDRMYRRGYRDGQFRWFAGCMLAAAPIGVCAMMATTPWLFLTLLGFFLALMAALPACYSAALNLATPNELRGTGIAFFAGTAGLIGMASGPLLIAAASDLIFGEGAIGSGMAVVIAVCCPLGALILAKGCGAMREAVLELEAKTQ